MTKRLGFGVWGLGFGFWGWDLGFGVWVLGFGVRWRYLAKLLGLSVLVPGFSV